jgi:hypothetical protein
MEAVRVLRDEIGTRPSCSSGERRAAAWCAARLSEEGYDVAVEEFPSRRSSSKLFFVYLAVSAVGALLIVPLPLLAALIGMVALVLYGREVDGRPLIEWCDDTSRNVVARPRGTSAPTMVVTAPLDSGPAFALFDRSRSALFQNGRHAVHVALFAVPVVGAGAWIAEAGSELPRALTPFSFVLCAFLLLAGGLLLASSSSGETGETGDGAPAVEVVLRLAASPNLENVWFVLAGSNAVGTLGLQAFVDAHGPEVASSRFLNISEIGSGVLGATTEEGVLRERRADRTLWGAAESAGAGTRPLRGFPGATSTLIARRFRAATLTTFSPDDRYSDEDDEVREPAPEEVVLDSATRVARAVILETLTSEIRR